MNSLPFLLLFLLHTFPLPSSSLPPTTTTSCTTPWSFSPTTPFPTSQLPPNTLEPYLPLILQELESHHHLHHQHDQRTQRTTISYGYSFFLMEQNDFSIPLPVPSFLQQLGSLLCTHFQVPNRIFDNVILSYYEEGYYLEPHTDVHHHSPVNGFWFGEEVFGLVLIPDSTGHFFLAHYVPPSSSSPSSSSSSSSSPNSWEVIKPPTNLPHFFDLEEKEGTAFFLTGPARFEPYYHGVSRVSNRRLSLTFRTVVVPSSSSSS